MLKVGCIYKYDSIHIKEYRKYRISVKESLDYVHMIIICAVFYNYDFSICRVAVPKERSGYTLISELDYDVNLLNMMYLENKKSEFLKDIILEIFKEKIEGFNIY